VNLVWVRVRVGARVNLAPAGTRGDLPISPYISRDLAPAAGCGAKVDRARHAVEEAELLIDLQELEG